ncbi:MAG: tetratricopeptide repeat protein, partial [Anaerolineae bacterium]|nr:tetratricopeptide repeat protein [Anaerolineae bacterium]
LGNDPALIVLDNFEHLTELAPLLVDCLQRSPRLTILVTSRQLLGLSSETVLTLGGLPYPDLDAEPKSSPEAYAAVAYFISVVKQGHARWQPSTENLPQIAQVCKTLDGHPLALNLSARWALLESVSGIAEQLRLGNALLVTDASDIPPRQRNIDAILGTTIRYLEPEEKRVYPRLGVLEGEFSLEALLTIADTSRVTVRSLIYHGIMEITEPGYFRLHPLISRHALQELRKTSEEATVWQRFQEYYTSFACELAPDLRPNISNQKRFAREWHHIRAVWKRALAHGDVERLRLLQRPLHFFAWQSSNLDAMALLETVLEVPLLSQIDPVLCANVHICRLQLRIASEPSELLIEEGREAIAVLEDHSPGFDLAFGLYMLSMVYRENGQWQPAYDCASRALLLCEELGQRWGIMIGKYQLGLLFAMAGNHHRALKYWQIATKLAQQVNDSTVLETIQHRMGQLLWHQGKQEEAISLLEDLLRTEEVLISAETYGGL